MAEKKSNQEKVTKDEGSFLQKLLIKYNHNKEWTALSLHEQTITDMAKANRFDAITGFLSGVGGIADGSQFAVAQDLITQYYQSAQGGQVLSKQDVEFLQYMREIKPFTVTIFQAYARSVSAATSTSLAPSKSLSRDAEKKENENKAVLNQKEASMTAKEARDAAKAWQGTAVNRKPKPLKPGAKGKISKAKNTYIIHDQFDGQEFDPRGGLNSNDPDYVTAAHIIPDKATNNEQLMYHLNHGFSENYDVNSKRNIVLIKNKYSAALEAHKICISWTKDKGYHIKVHPNYKSDFGYLDNKALLFYEQGKETQTPRFPPYRRAIAYSYLSMEQRVDLIFHEMRKISMNGFNDSNDENDYDGYNDIMPDIHSMAAKPGKDDDNGVLATAIQKSIDINNNNNNDNDDDEPKETNKADK